MTCCTVVRRKAPTRFGRRITQLDLWARRNDGKIGRPWLTIIIDDYSRAIAGFFPSLGSPSAGQTALALRQAIWRKAEPDWKIFGIRALSTPTTAASSGRRTWNRSVPT